MKTFKDVHFEIRRPSGIIGKIDLGNDVEISIIMHESSYGGTQGLWEIACFDKKGQVDLECLGYDVIGFLTFTELETKIREIQEELYNNKHINKRIYFASYNNGEVTGEIFEKENNYECAISEQHGTGSSSFLYEFETFVEALVFIHENIYKELLT